MTSKAETAAHVLGVEALGGIERPTIFLNKIIGNNYS